jgi:hypothetical protein
MTALDRRTVMAVDTNYSWREGMSDHGLDYNVA